MNKTAIKNYAVWARVQLIKAVEQRAYEYGITADGYGEEKAEIINGSLLSRAEKEQRAELVSEIKIKGYDQVMEEVAYTWFNRFIALRYMEVNGYLPSKVRVFTNENGEFKPELLTEAVSIEIDGLDRSKVLDYLDKQDNEALYKYLLITQCNALNDCLPGMFEKINNYTELLFPNKLLSENSVIEQLVTKIDEDDWKDAVQIIGWLYQFYNSELKDETYAALKKNVKMTKEKIPAVTQLFTPDWIVRYMVENSLGRLWYEGHGDFDKSQWKYYLDEAEQDEAVKKQLAEINAEYSTITPESIKLIDPSMGSGHILVYAFDVLMQIYLSQGWNERDAARSIVENNLYGIDIDERAYQLAYFAVMMKARSYSRRILNEKIKNNLCAIVETNNLNRDYLSLFGELEESAKALADEFIDTKEYGSMINVKASVEEIKKLIAKCNEIKESVYDNMFDSARQSGIVTLFEPILKQALLLAQKYDVVVTNPPYMVPTPKQKPFVEKNYPDSKSDLFAIFIEKCKSMTLNNRYCAMITMHSWMFLSSFEKLRIKLLSVDIINMAHLGARAFEEIGGEVVQTTSFVIRKSHVSDYKGKYCRLIEPTTQQGKEEMFLAEENRYIADQSNFTKIPGSPIAYWVKNIEMFNFQALGEYIDARIGMVSGDNERFLRLWFEVLNLNIEYSAKPKLDPMSKKWYPLQKGGDFRKWYGNNGYVLNWENDGYELKFNNYMGKRVRSHNYNGMQQFKEGITWNSISASKFHCRYSPTGFTYDAAGPLCEVTQKGYLWTILGFLSTKVSEYIFSIINPTINFPSGYLESLPFAVKQKEKVDEIVEQCINVSKEDWDSFETSWDFKKNPLI